MKYVQRVFLALCTIPVLVGLVGRVIYVSVEVGMDMADDMMQLIASSAKGK